MSDNKQKRRLTEMVRNCGCAAKLAPGILADVLSGLDVPRNDNVIVGIENSDDAGAYRLDDGRILLQTLDFFPANNDDPYTFGQIAAANALSDIYAMGGTPVTALNIVCFPGSADISILREILRGGADKVRESGAVVMGGHTVEDPEPKYGLSVTGITDAEHLLANRNAAEGDVLILTKPIGTGIIVSALKGGIAGEGSAKEAVGSMTSLNKAACEAMGKFRGVHGCTDVTGFSLGGHAIEMAKASSLTIEIESGSVPVIEGAAELAEEGIVPQGTYRNKDFFGPDSRFAADFNEDLIFDPQTSGGLLISVSEEDADGLMRELKAELSTRCGIIGRVTAKSDKYLIVK